MAGQAFACEVEGLGSLAENFTSLGSKAIIAAGLTKMTMLIRAAAMAKAAPHRKTGSLQRSITSEVDPELLIGYVGTVDKRGPWFEFGTGIHGPTGQRITPKHANVMAWPGGSTRLTGAATAGSSGAMIFAKSTKGMVKAPWLVPGFEEAQGAFEPILDSMGHDLAMEALAQIKSALGGKLAP
jgi:hypothetical protein